MFAARGVIEILEEAVAFGLQVPGVMPSRDNRMHFTKWDSFKKCGRVFKRNLVASGVNSVPQI